MHEKDKEDVIRFGQNVHTTQAFSKKETLKRPVSSLEGSITKLLTLGITGLKKRYLFQIPVHSIVRGELPHRNPNELHMEILILL